MRWAQIGKALQQDTKLLRTVGKNITKRNHACWILQEVELKAFVKSTHALWFLLLTLAELSAWHLPLHIYSSAKCIVRKCYLIMLRIMFQHFSFNILESRSIAEK